MLGRPFGAPNHAAFQRQVLLAALQLLERETGPVLEDFPLDAPPDRLTQPPAELACPVSFPRLKTEGSLADNLADEVTQLQAWYDVAVKHHGRTTLGVTGLTPAAIVAYLASWLSGMQPAAFRHELSPGDALKQACDELKAFYYEAKSAQPGTHSSKSIQDWFWLETAGGQTLLKIRDIATGSTDKSVKGVSAMSIVPRAVDVAMAAAAAKS